MARVEEFYEQARVIHSQFAYCSVCQELHHNYIKTDGFMTIGNQPNIMNILTPKPFKKWWQFWK